MKYSDFPRLGPVLMVFGVTLLITTALSSSVFPWFRAFLGLSGAVLFFVGFRFLTGPAYILCPRCQTKNYIQNRSRRTLITDRALTCVKCGTILRRDRSS